VVLEGPEVVVVLELREEEEEPAVQGVVLMVCAAQVEEAVFCQLEEEALSMTLKMLVSEKQVPQFYEGLRLRE
jgi:hypothetical protein